MATIKMACIDKDAYVAAAEKQAEAIVTEAQQWAAIQVAIMVAQNLIDDEISDMQASLANRRYQLAKNLIDHAKKTWVKEKAFVQETMAELLHTPDYTKAQSMIAEVDSKEQIALDSVEYRMQCMGIEYSQCDSNRMQRAIAQGRADLVSHAMRAAEGRSHALNDRRYSRQYAVIGLGRGILRDAVALGSLGGGTQLALSGALMSTINSGVALWGYTSTRWQQGGNYATGPNGVTRVIPSVVPQYEATMRPELPRVQPEVADVSTSWMDKNDWSVLDTLPPK